MSKEIRVLILEDTPSDAELIERELKKMKFQVSCKTVETKEEFSKELHHYEPDIILSDYHLPTFSGDEALRIVRDRTLEKPFIFVTGELGEEKAIETLKSGATDYVLKDNLKRLSPVILRAINDYEDFLSSKRIKDQERLATRVLDLLNKSINERDKIKEILSLIMQTSGCDAVGIRLKKGEDFPYYESVGFSEKYLSIEKNLFQYSGETVNRDSSGNPVFKCLCGCLVLGLTDKSQPYFTDIGSFWTNNLPSIFENENVKKFLHLSHKTCYLEGYQSMAIIPLLSDKEIIGLLQLNSFKKDIFTEDSIIFYEGLGSSIGIALARARAEEAMHNSEVKHRILFNTSADGILIADIENKKFLYANPAICKMLGYTKEEIVRLGVSDIHPKEDLPYVIGEFEAQARGDKIIAPDIPCMRKDGTVFFADVSTVAAKIDGVLCNMGYFRDISDRKKVEEEIKESRELYKSIFENTGTATIIVNENTLILHANEECLKVTGYSPEQLLGTSWVKYVASDSLEMMKKFNIQRLQDPENAPNRYETNLVNEKGEIRTAILSIGSIPNSNNLVVSMLDITERKLAEDALKVSEERLKEAQRLGKIGNWEFDILNNKLTWSDETYVLYERDKSLGPLSPEEEAKYYSPEQAKTLRDYAAKAINNSQGFTYDLEVKLQNEKKMYCYAAMNPVIDSNGKVIKLFGTIQDITERKLSETILAESEEKYRALIENANETISVVQDGFIKFTNTNFIKLTGYTLDEYRNISIEEIIHPDDREVVMRNLTQRSKGESVPSQYIFRIIDKNKNIKWLDRKVTHLTWEGRPALLVMDNDITERKKDELEIIRLNRLYSFISQINQMLVRTKDKDTLFNEVCKIAIEYGKFRMAWVGLIDDNCQIVQPYTFEGFEEGYLLTKKISVLEEPEGRGPTGIALREEKIFFCNDIANDPKMEPWREEAIKRGYRSSIALPFKLNGKVIGCLNIYSSEVGFFNEDEIKLLQEVADDISYALDAIEKESLRSEAEEAMRISEKKYRDVIENATDIIFTTDLKGNYQYANSASLKITGYSLEELRKLNYLDLILPEHQLRVKHHYLKQFAGKIPSTYIEYKTRNKDGKILWFGQNATMIEEDGKIFGFHLIARDITDLKCAEETLRKNEKQFRKFFNEDLTGDFLTTVDGKILQCNPAFVKMLGYDTVEEIMNINTKQLYPSSDYREEFLNDLMANKTIKEKEIVLKRRDGVLRNFIENVVGIFDENDNLIQLQGYLFDVTDRKKAENELLSSRERLQHYFMSSPTIIYSMMIDEDNKLITNWISENITGALGYTLEEALEPNWWFDNINKVDFERINPNYEKIYIDDIIINEYRFYHKNGKEYWVYEEERLIRDKEGNPTEIIGSWTDITDKKKSEAALRESEEKHRSLFETMEQGVVYQDSEGKIISANPAAERILGLSLDQMLGRKSIDPRWKTIHEDGSEFSGENHPAMVSLITCKNVSNKIMGVYNPKDDSYKWINVSAVPQFKEGEDKPYRVFTTFSDITKLFEAEKKLIAAKEEAEMMNRLKSNFLANMSHELRTPLTGILGFTQILSESAESDENKEFAKLVHESGKRLMDTLNQILDLSRIEANKQEINFAETNIAEIVENSAIIFKAFAEKKNLYLNVIHKDKLVSSELDKDLLNKIINNLVKNALIYTQKGGVTIEVDSVKENSQTWARIKVIDTGIGISKSNLDLIFEEFRQVSEGLGRSYEGTGLGLTITKSFVGLMNGKIFVESQEGKGSIFTVQFPATISNDKIKKVEIMTPEVKKDKTEVIDNIKEVNKSLLPVLLVEDDMVCQILTQKYLKDVCMLKSVINADLAIKAADEKQFSLVLMDINLGRGMNGLKAMNEIKKIPGYENIPFIALTAYAMESDKEVFLKEGCVDYISKPFTRDELVRIIEKNL